MSNNLKTRKIVKAPLSDSEELLIENPPYTIIGSTSIPAIPASFSVLLKVSGLKQMLKGLKDDDMLRIEMFSGYKATEFSIIKKEKK